MQLIQKKINGKKYWYVVKKGRKKGTVTNIETVYIGKTEQLIKMLGLGDEEVNVGAIPVGQSTMEIGASAALWNEAEAIHLVDLIDGVCGSRRDDAKISYGKLITLLAIQSAVAPVNRKSARRLSQWYSESGIQRLIPASKEGLDVRRVHEALSQLSAKDIEQLEVQIIKNVIATHKVSLDCLAFDATNFDSYASSLTISRLLKRGNAKSKRTNLRIMGLGMLVTADDGLPLLSFVYPGNHPDVKTFGSFLSRLARRKESLPLSDETTVVCDGGNISEEIVHRLERAKFHFAARLPIKHAPDADALKTHNLKPVSGRLAVTVKAKKLRTMVYNKLRTVVAVFSKTMKDSQIPGIERDIAKAKRDLEKLQLRLIRQKERNAGRHHLTKAKARSRADGLLYRQYMSTLFQVSLYGTEQSPTLQWKFRDDVWKDIQENRLGRTVVLTDRDDWSEQKIIESLREQSHAENAFRNLKNPKWTSALPLRRRIDRSLRIHGFVTVLGLLLGMLARRRLRQRGIEESLPELLDELSQLRLGKLRYGTDATPALRKFAEKNDIPPCPTTRQKDIFNALGLKKYFSLGPTIRQV